MKISNLEFSAVEECEIKVQAALRLIRKHGRTQEEAEKELELMTPQNLVRLALGFETRQRGGSRENAGRPAYTDE